MSHTPGPWVANVSDEARGGFGAIRVESENEHGEVNDGWCIAEFAGSDARHNALLAAAAPDLLEALKAILPAAGDGYGHNPHAKKPGDCAGCDAVVAARAAIAKVEGKS